MRFKKITIIILSVVSVLVGGIGFGIYHFFFDINSVPTGQYISESKSPDGKYTIKAYVSIVALSSDAIRCELVNNDTGKKHNIYWGYRESDTTIIWKDNITVTINGKILDITKDTYDWRRE